MKLPRRHLLGGLGGAAALAPWSLHAQPRATLRVGTVGVLGMTGGNYDVLRARMADLGYVEGRNFVFDFVTVERPVEYASAYASLVAGGAHILLAVGNELALEGARQAAAGRTPVVFLAIDFDPVQIGYVASMARPGGNLTGLYVRQAELAAKRIEVAREALPKMRRLALWWDSLSHDSEAAAAAAKATNLEVGFVGVAGQPPDYDAALRLSARLSADAVLLTASPTYLQARTEIMRLALKARVPVIAAFRECATAGALLSYGIDLPAIFQDIAAALDRIARGAKPADMPIGQPARFELVVNLKTAKALGFTLPDSLLARVDQVIA